VTVARLIGIALVSVAIVLAWTGVGASRSEARGDSVPSCTPELVYVAVPGTVSASGSGLVVVPSLDLTDKDGEPVVTGEATIEWQAQNTLEQPAEVGARPILGGNLTLLITTAEGHRITFDATCIAGSGAVSDDGLQGMFVFATGLVKGWPGIPAQNAMVFFQAFSAVDGIVVISVEIYEGRDCSLNFETHLTTEGFFPGSGSLSASPPGISYSETDCAARHGAPKPAEKAPGQN
jgi:hypothetical protein